MTARERGSEVSEGLSVEPCPLCDGDVLLTKDDAVGHMLGTHPPTLLATYIALVLFCEVDADETDGKS